MRCICPPTRAIYSQGVLIDPNGETPSEEGNVTPSGAQTKNLVNVTADPIPGRWRYVVVVQNPISGNQLTENFTGVVTFNQVKVTGALPAGGSLRAGKAHKVQLVLTNTGPLALCGADRCPDLGDLAGAIGPAVRRLHACRLPLSVDELSDMPAYLVPPDTSKLALTASSTVPAQVELSSPAGGIDLFGDLQSAQDGSTVSTATVSEHAPAKVGQGYWFTYVQEIGPYGDGGAPAGETTLTAIATTAGFDRPSPPRPATRSWPRSIRRPIPESPSWSSRVRRS